MSSRHLLTLLSKTACPPRACRAATVCVLALAAGLIGCATRTNLAPVEERTPTPVGTGTGVLAGATATASTASAAPTAPVAGPAAAASAPDASASRPAGDGAAGPGQYVVKPGDTLVRIGLDTGQNWRDIARWNSIDNPNVLEVGQVLRVVPPGSEAGVATTRPVAPAPRIESRPLEARPPASGAAAGAPATPVAAPVAVPAPAAAPPGPASVAAAPAAAAATTPPAAARDDGDISWSWPAAGPVTSGFDDVRSKGLAIGGKAGDPVLAAADGRVVYAGSGLRGYGNLVIVKHNATYLTAYAHNQTLLVKEDQVVRRGQKIAEMGSSDTDRVQLHFEVRRLGKPVDPAKVLPAR